MAYCRNCATSIGDSREVYCGSCENRIVGEAKREVASASQREQTRMQNDQRYAHDWLQGVIGWITGLWDLCSKIFRSGCFITSAVVEYKGLNDSSEEMQALRVLRSEYVATSGCKKRKATLEEYYILGPSLINWINSRLDKNEIWEHVSLYVFESIELVKKGEMEKAYNLFEKRTRSLVDDILILRHKNNK